MDWSEICVGDAVKVLRDSDLEKGRRCARHPGEVGVVVMCEKGVRDASYTCLISVKFFTAVGEHWDQTFLDSLDKIEVVGKA